MAAAISTGPVVPRAHAEAAAALTGAGAGSADMVYRHGYVYTVDAHDSVQTALAIRAGRIVYVGSDAGLAPFMSPKTTVVDLHGRMLMPGLVDGHLQGATGRAAVHRNVVGHRERTGRDHCDADAAAGADDRTAGGYRPTMGGRAHA